MTPRPPRRTGSLLVAAALLASGCATSPEADDVSPSATPGPTTSEPVAVAPVPAPSPSATAAPADPARRQVDWFLGVLAGDELTERTYRERFSERFRTQVAYGSFVEITEQLRAAGPYRVRMVEPGELSDLEVLLDTDAGDRLRLVLSVDADERIRELVVGPADPPTLDDPPLSPTEAADRLDDAGELRMVAAEVRGTTCAPTFERAAEELAPLGSIFKLYVLGAVADAVTAGALSWDERLTITDDVKSLPSGILQDREDGTEVTVREAAELMIAISDNTATDLLLQTVGRDAVERAQSAYGHRTPSANDPFLTTRELFALKAAEPDVRAEWVAADAQQRRALLDGLGDVDVTSLPLDIFAEPRQPDEIGWFASPLDVCRALATLWERSNRPGLAPLRGILTANPGVPDDRNLWDRVAFKGGSETGLLAASWLMIDDEGRRFALTGSVVDPTAPVDTTRLTLLFAAARDTIDTTSP